MFGLKEEEVLGLGARKKWVSAEQEEDDDARGQGRFYLCSSRLLLYGGSSGHEVFLVVFVMKNGGLGNGQRGLDYSWGFFSKTSTIVIFEELRVTCGKCFKVLFTSSSCRRCLPCPALLSASPAPCG